METIDKAYSMAKDILRGNYKEHGIFAGKHYFDDYWARDSFFSSIASLALKDYEIVKKNLLLFIKFQKENGQIPLRVGAYNIIPKILGLKFRGKLRARYKEDKNISFPLDQNLLFVIVACYYILKTKDRDFANRHFENFKKALRWASKYEKDHLLYEKPYSGWEDSLNIEGFTLYNNVLYYEALKCFSLICKILKNDRVASTFFRKGERVKDLINKKFWNNKFYCSFIKNKKRHNYFSTTGNLLAIHFGIADKDKALSIEKCIEEFRINKFVPSLTNYPIYPIKYIYFPFYTIGMQDYHNGLCWLWLGCLNVITKSRVGLKKEASLLLKRISEIILLHNGIYEVYEKEGHPVRRLMYKSEYDFSWAAAFFILAYRELY